MRAYIQISTDSTRDAAIQKLIRKMPNCTYADRVFGDWDIIALFEVGSAEELGKLIVGKIRGIPGVKITKTLVVSG